MLSHEDWQEVIIVVKMVESPSQSLQDFKCKGYLKVSGANYLVWEICCIHPDLFEPFKDCFLYRSWPAL